MSLIPNRKQSPPKQSRVVTTIAWTTVIKLCSQVLTLATTIVLTRLLTKGDFGLMAMTILYTGLIDTLIDFGFVNAIVQCQRLAPRQLSSCYWLLTLVSLILALLTYFGSPQLAALFGDVRLIGFLHVVSLVLLSLPMQIICKGILSRELRVDTLVALELVAGIARSIVSIGLAWRGLGALSLGFGLLAEKLFLAISLPAYARWHPLWEFKRDDLKQLLPVGLQMSLSNILWFLYYRTDTFVIGRVLGAETLGIYTIATQIAVAGLQFVTSTWHRLAYPLYARYQSSPELPELFLISSGVLTAVATPLFVGIAAVADDIIALLYGPTWQGAVVPLQVMAIVTAMQASSTLLGQLLNAVGAAKANTHINFYSALTFVLAFYLSALQWGLNGILGTWMVLFPLRYFVYLRLADQAVSFSLRQYAKWHFGTICACLLMVFSVGLSNEQCHDCTLAMRLPTSVLIGAISYLLAQALVNRKLLSLALIRLRTTNAASRV